MVDKGRHVVQTAVGAMLPVSSPISRGVRRQARRSRFAMRYVLFTDNLADLSVAEAVQAARKAPGSTAWT